MSASTGVISGTPTAVTAAASYTVTASNSAGSTTASLSITVYVAAPAGLSYTTGTGVYTVATTIPADSPTSTGGTVASYHVVPALPAGLTLSASTGVISGTPTVVTAAGSYTITASNSTGSTTTTLTITVNAPPLSAANINLIFVVSQDLAFQDQASGDVSPSTANLTNKGLQRSLLMAPFLQQAVLGMNNVTGIYALEPMTHLQTAGNYPDMVALETIQQFAMLNQITLSGTLPRTVIRSLHRTRHNPYRPESRSRCSPARLARVSISTTRTTRMATTKASLRVSSRVTLQAFMSSRRLGRPPLSY